MKIERFEDIIGWQKARELTKAVYAVTGNGQFSNDYGLRDQIRRAAGSVMHNIAEGFDAGSDRDFGRFLIYARRSATEVQSQLYLAIDQCYITPDQFSDLYTQAQQIKAALSGLIRYLNTNSLRDDGDAYLFEDLTQPHQTSDFLSGGGRTALQQQPDGPL